MITSKTLRTITDMRKNADGLLRLANQNKQPIGILKNSKLEAYIIDAETLESLENVVEHLLDIRMVKNRLVEAKKGDFRDFESFWTQQKLPK